MGNDIAGRGDMFSYGPGKDHIGVQSHKSGVGPIMSDLVPPDNRQFWRWDRLQPCKTAFMRQNTLGSQLSSVVEQRFCKPSVVGSNPTAGSIYSDVEELKPGYCIRSRRCRGKILMCRQSRKLKALIRAAENSPGQANP